MTKTEASKSADQLAAALNEMLADYKAGARLTDNEIRATAKWYGVDACELYAQFDAAIAAATGSAQ